MKKDTTKAKKPKSTANKPVVTPKRGATKAKVEVEIRHMSELAPKDKAYLEELLRISPDALTEGELAHLSARVAYLNTDERKKYGL